MSNTVIKKTKYSNQSGFTLVEMSIVLAIVGLLIGGGLSFYKPLDQNLRTAETKERMFRVANALSAYALRNNRIPCPADPAATSEPFGAELGSGSDGEDMGSCTSVQTEGIVPYRTLGIRQEDIIDGYGSYLTYHVSPVFTTDNGSGGSGTVHDRCRTAQWMNSSDDNANPNKARFCCPTTSTFNAGTDIIIDDAGGTNVISNIRSSNTGGVNSEESSPSGSPLAVVYALVSHGSNRYGKFLIGGTTPTSKYTQTDVFGGNEGENQDGDRNFFDGVEISAETTAYYDDIILWRTQDSILSELGTNSCALP